MNIKKAKDLDSYRLPRPGNIYKYNGNFYISYSVTEYNRHADDKGIIKWGYEKRGERKGGLTPKDDTPLFFLIPLIESSTIPKISEGDKVYNYTFLGKDRIATWHTYSIKVGGEKKEVKDNFRLDLTIDCNDVTKEDVAESIAIFFNIVDRAGKENENAGAPEDIEEAMKLVLGRECSPFRFIPALGHQLMRYIVGAFDFKKGVPGNLGTPDNRLFPGKTPDALGSYNEMVQSLFNFVNECAEKSKDLQTQERFRSAIEIIELIFFHKAFRNKESHSEYKINNPVLYTNYYLIDHIMLVYALVYLLKVTPKEWLSDDKTKFDASLPTNEEKKEFYNYKETDYKDLITLCLQRLKDIESDALTEEKVENIIREAISKNNRLTDDCIKKLESEVNDSTEYIKEHLSEIEKIKEHENQLNECREKIEKLESKTDKNEAEIEELKRQKQLMLSIQEKLGYWDENVITQIEAHEKEIGRILKLSKKAIFISIAGVILLAFFIFALFGIPYMSWSISNEDCYKFSKLLPWAPTDLSYDRAIYLENKLQDNLIGKGLESFLSETNTIGNIELRNQIKNAYLDAIDKYENLNKSDEKYGERHFRLAQMYLRGKGGIIDNDKALENADIAIRNGFQMAKGLKSYILIAYKLSSEKVGSEAWRHAVKSATPPYSDLVYLMDKMAKIQNSNKIPDKEEINSIEKEFEKLTGIDSKDSEALVEAAFIYSQLCRNWLFNKNDIVVIGKPFLVGLNWLYGLAIGFNYLPAQLESLLLAKKTNNFEWFRIIANQMFQNGFKSIAVDAYNYWVVELNNSEEQFDYDFPGFLEVKKSESESFIDLYHLAIDSYKKGNLYLQKEMQDSASVSYMDALYYYRLAEKQTPPNLYFKMGNLAHWIRVRGSDSLAMEWKKQLLHSPRPDQRDSFREGLDSISKFKAWEAYVTAYFMEHNFAGYKNNTDSVLNLISYASKSGLDKATYSLGLSDFENNRIEECINKMKSIAERNDDACIWLAERFRRSNPDESMKYVGMIKDSLNLYKNIMIMRNKLDRKYPLDLDESISQDDVRRLYQSFNCSNMMEECQQAAFFELASIIEMIGLDKDNIDDDIQHVLNWAYLNLLSKGPLYGLGKSMMVGLSEKYKIYMEKHPELKGKPLKDNPIYSEIMQMKYDCDTGLLYSKVVPALAKNIAGRELYHLFPDSFNLNKNIIFSEKDVDRIKLDVENIKKLISSVDADKIQSFLSVWQLYETLAFTNSYITPLVTSYNFINIEP